MRKTRTVKNPSLGKLLGNKWRITHEEAWDHETKEVREQSVIDYEEVKLRGGGCLRIHDLKKKIFVLWTQRYKLAYEVAAEHPEIKLDRMDLECDLYIPHHLVDIVLERFHGAKKKVMSAAWREKSSERMKAMQAAKKAKREQVDANT